MGLLDDAIREHLELKKRRGADPAEVAKQEREALGPIGAGAAAAPAVAEPEADLAPYDDDEPGSRTSTRAPSARPSRSRSRTYEPRAGSRARAGAASPAARGRRRRRRRPRRRPRARRAAARSTSPPSSTRSRTWRTCAARRPRRPRTSSPPTRPPRPRTSSTRRPSSSRRRRSTTGSGSSSARRATSISEHRLTWLDVFTRTPLTGNQLAVVHDADGVSDDTMLAFARETRLSETTFVQSSSEGADYRCRIWMTRRELPFAGHPSLGTAVAVALARGDREVGYVQQTRAGLQPIEVEVLDERTARASMLQEPATFGPELDPAVVLGPAGVDPSLAAAGLPAQVVDTGVPQILVPVERDALDAAAPRLRHARGAARRARRRHALPVCDRRGPRVRPVALRRPGRDERGPGDGLRRRAAHGLPPRAPGPGRRCGWSRASRWAAPACSSARSRATACGWAATRSSSRAAP